MTNSLIDYAENVNLPDPLPALEARRSRRDRHGYMVHGAWPADSLPGEAIAEDLARLGVSFLRGTGYAVNGAYREADQIGRMIADVLDNAASALPANRAATLKAHAAQIEDGVDVAQAAALDDPRNAYDVVGDDLGGILDVTALAAGAALARVIRSEEGLDVVDDERVESQRRALRATSADLRSSPAARARALGTVRPHLPASTEAAANVRAAVAFLATFDSRDKLRSSELAALYSEAGNPGKLTPGQLRELAGERWGATRKLDGYPTYRPSTAIELDPPEPLPAAPAPEQRLMTFVELAADYAGKYQALEGTLPKASDLVAFFGIRLGEAREVLAQLYTETPSTPPVPPVLSLAFVRARRSESEGA